MCDLANSKHGDASQRAVKRFVQRCLPLSFPIYKPVEDFISFHDGENRADNLFLDSTREPRVLLLSSAELKVMHSDTISESRKVIHLNIKVFADSDESSNVNVLYILLQRALAVAKDKYLSKHPVANIHFSALAQTLVPYVEKFLSDNGYEMVYRENCNLWVADKTKCKSFENQIPLLKSDELQLRPLSSKLDAELVNSTWKYKSNESFEKVMNIIESGNPTVGLYFNNKLVSWAVTYPDGSSGMLYTLESHRRKGYAITVMRQLFYYRSQSKLNYCEPFDYIVINNTKSENLFKKLNFKPVQRVDWVGFKATQKIVTVGEGENLNFSLKWDKYFAETESLLPWENGQPASRLQAFLENKSYATTGIKRAVDVGCGSGYNTHLLCKHFSTVVGVDISKYALAKARLNLYHKFCTRDVGTQAPGSTSKIPSNIEFYLGNLFDESSMAQLNNTFDFLFDIQVFHALRNLGESTLVRAFANLLVVGGYCMVICGDAGDALRGEEKQVGPSVVSKYELIKAFSPYFDLIFVEKGVFDATASYENFPCLTSLWKKR